MDALSQRLIQERQSLIQRAAAVTQNADDDNHRDLNEAEMTTLSNLQGRMAQIDAQLALTTADLALNADTAANLAKWNTGMPQPQPGVAWRSAGEVLYDFLHQHEDRDSRERVRAGMGHARELQANGKELQVRAAQHMGYDAANTVPTAGDMSGLIVNPVVGPIINLAWNGSPFVNSFGTSPSPNAFSFQRPRLIDPDLDTAAGPQAGGKEKAELPSKAFNIDADTVKLTVIGSYLNVSLQLETLQPGSLDIVIAQLGRRTARGVENAGIAELAKATKIVTVDADAGAAGINSALFEAAAAVFTATDALPSILVMGPLGFARLGGETDLAGRPVFPWLGPTNANGTISADGSISLPFGRSVITPGIKDDSIYLLNGLALELYRFNFPLLQAIEPSVLGRQVAVASALGAYQVPTTEAVTGGTPSPALYEGIVKIEFAAA